VADFAMEVHANWSRMTKERETKLVGNLVSILTVLNGTSYQIFLVNLEKRFVQIPSELCINY
jgi:hypothetical protein